MDGDGGKPKCPTCAKPVRPTGREKPGRVRPNKMPSPTRTVGLPLSDEAHKRLEILVETTGCSRAVIVERSLRIARQWLSASQRYRYDVLLAKADLVGDPAQTDTVEKNGQDA